MDVFASFFKKEGRYGVCVGCIYVYVVVVVVFEMEYQSFISHLHKRRMKKSRYIDSIYKCARTLSTDETVTSEAGFFSAPA